MVGDWEAQEGDWVGWEAAARRSNNKNGCAVNLPAASSVRAAYTQMRMRPTVRTGGGGAYTSRLAPERSLMPSVPL